MTYPEVTLQRLSEGYGGTWGILTYAPAQLSLHTVERLWDNNAFGSSCVPVGRYLVRATYSPRFGRKMYLLLGTEPRTGIRIHPANWPKQLNGCIALGTSVALKPDCKMLLNSRVAVNRLERTFGLQPFYINILGGQYEPA